MSGKVHAFGAAAQWDQRRNSSLVIPVAPDALPNAMRALRAFRESDPALYAWVAEGAPNLTGDEHVQRFGEPYRSSKPAPSPGAAQPLTPQPFPG